MKKQGQTKVKAHLKRNGTLVQAYIRSEKRRTLTAADVVRGFLKGGENDSQRSDAEIYERIERQMDRYRRKQGDKPLPLYFHHTGH